MKVIIEFTDGKKIVKDFGENVMKAFEYQAQFVKKSNVKLATFEGVKWNEK